MLCGVDHVEQPPCGDTWLPGHPYIALSSAWYGPEYSSHVHYSESSKIYNKSEKILKGKSASCELYNVINNSYTT